MQIEDFLETADGIQYKEEFDSTETLGNCSIFF